MWALPGTIRVNTVTAVDVHNELPVYESVYDVVSEWSPLAHRITVSTTLNDTTVA